ncbi:hypothetical protein J437_LFUL005797 [Ladona fulva]|uniref:Ig-like domain-containing protein n=1 Tax=Ladona fulva TaxID=123851 RepID=A0A8K0K1H3_LADFU|nr:hypothetical protein J437_LFUL005797 [Ladona fulva]
MDCNLSLFFLFSLMSTVIFTEGKVELVITPSPKPKGLHPLLKRVEDTLNLTCSVTSPEKDMLPKYELVWQLPFTPQNSQNRVTIEPGYNVLSLMVQNLKEGDSGDYNCEAKFGDEFIRETVKISVKNKKNCNEHMFYCPSETCISRRYVCDGYQDCKSGADEWESYCGTRPCEGKLPCEGRCIPLHWCCDQHTDPNCTVRIRPTCCKHFESKEHHEGSTSEQQRYSDMGFLQTTIYTVIGCAMAFMFIVTILVVAICRVHMKRTSTLAGMTHITALQVVRRNRQRNSEGRLSGSGAGRGPAAHSLLSSHSPHEFISSDGSASPIQSLQLYDLDFYLNAASGIPSGNARDAPQNSQNPHSLLVTYNINNGVQFVGRPVDPPPYCEVMSAPPREGPPPPYVSREDISSPPPNTQGSSPPSALSSNTRESVSNVRAPILNSRAPLLNVRTNSVTSPIHTVSSSPVILQTVEESHQTDEEDRNCEPQPTDSLIISTSRETND